MDDTPEYIGLSAESEDNDERYTSYNLNWRHRSWSKTMFCSLLEFIHIGFLYNFGLFFNELQDEFHSDAALTAWVGSTSYCLFTFGTLLTTSALCYLSHRNVGLIGVLLGSVSLIAGSFSPSIIFLIIVYGIFFGLSSNISMFVTLDFMVVLFAGRRRAKAMTLVALGATIGNLSMCNLIDYILGQFGWRWTFRIFAVILLIVGITCCSFLGAPEGRKGCVEDVVDKTTPNGHWVCFPEIWFLSLATLGCAVAMAFQYVNMASFFTSIGFSDQMSATGIMVSALGDSTAKVVFIVIAPCISFPLIYCLPVCLLLSSILSLALTQTKNIIAIYIISFGVGAPRGIFNALQLATGLEVFGTSRSKTSANLLLFWSGIGNLTGPYIHGSLYDVKGSYYSAIYLCAGLYLVSSLSMLAAPLWQKYFAPDRYMIDYEQQKDTKHRNNDPIECIYVEQMISVV